MAIAGHHQIGKNRRLCPEYTCRTLTTRLLGEWQIDTKQKIGQLSQDQRQKLAIVRALAPDPDLLLLAAAITAVGAAFGALAVHLVGPESQTGRVIVQFVVMLGAMALYALVYWLIGRFGVAIGVPAALLVALPFGIGAWRSARKQYLTRAPCFDAPL